MIVQCPEKFVGNSVVFAREGPGGWFQEQVPWGPLFLPGSTWQVEFFSLPYLGFPGDLGSMPAPLQTSASISSQIWGGGTPTT